MYALRQHANRTLSTDGHILAAIQHFELRQPFVETYVTREQIEAARITTRSGRVLAGPGLDLWLDQMAKSGKLLRNAAGYRTLR